MANVTRALDIGSGSGFIALMLARQRGWHLSFRTDVSDNETRPPNRMLLALSPQAGEQLLDCMTIR